MKVLICGSRDWPSSRVEEIKQRISELPPATVVISGAARGVDSLAASFARSRELEVQEFPAKWEQHGRRAGFVRNLEMLNQRPDLVIAFQVGASRGTAHTINQAIARDVKVEVHSA